MTYLLKSSVEELSKLTGEEIVKRMINDNYDNSIEEQRSWENSLYLLIKQIKNAGLCNLTLVAEYSLTMDRRIDAIIFGYSRENRKPLGLIVELKQWSKINENIENQITKVNVALGARSEYRAHPIYQTDSYIKDLRAHHEEVAKRNIKVTAIQYLHNFSQDKSELFSNEYQIYKNFHDRLFIKNEENSLQKYFQSIFDSEKSGDDIASCFVHGKYILGEVSFNGLKKVLNDRDNAVMIADQVETAAKISNQLKNFRKSPTNQAVIIKGDAGTGKTIIGIHLLYLALRYGFYKNDLVFTFAKSKMLRDVLKNEAGLQQHFPYLDNLVAKNYSLIVVDEAHRIPNVNKTIVNLFKRDTKPKFVVFLQDDFQRVLPEEQGTVTNLSVELSKASIPFKIFSLEDQKRSGVQGNFVDNVHTLLYDRKCKVGNCGEFDIFCLQSLYEIDMRLLKHRDEKQTIKWFAPYDWKWKSRNNLLIKDDISIVDIDGTYFKKQWNPMHNQYEWYKNQTLESFDQVGSVYTAQGLDYDYTGFIWFEDLRWNKIEGRWIFDLSKMKDPVFVAQAERFLYKNGNSRAANEQILNIVLNQYYVLLTRAKKGLYVWFKDLDTKEYFLNKMIK